MARKCENWLSSFLQWTLPRSQAPESCLFFTGIFTLAATVRRHIRVPRKLATGENVLGGWECPPHMYIVLHGEAGVINKSTTLRFGDELLEEVIGLFKCPDRITIPDLLRKLGEESPDGSIYITSKELGDLVDKAGTEVYGLLISLFDGEKKYDESTISRGYVLVNNPCVNYAACTTPDWMRDNMTAGILNGGWGSRTLFIHEDAPRRRKLLYDDVETDFDVLKQPLIDDLNYIANLSGDFNFDSKATMRWFDEEWYAKQCIAKGELIKIKGYYNRKPAYVMKIAMLMKIAYSDELVLTREDLEQAIAVLDAIEPKMLKVFGGIGRNVYTADVNSIERYVKDKGKVARALLLRDFQSAAEPVMLESLLQSMVAMEMIDMINEGKDIYYVSG